VGTARGPVTPAVRMLRAAGVEFTEHLYAYEEHGGTRVSARELGVDEHSVVKTLVMQDERKAPLIALMHGDMNVSVRSLGRCIGARTIQPCDPAVAQRHTGYMVGGTSPFGTRRAMPVYMQRTILDLPRIYINGGKRGFLLGIEPTVLLDLLTPTCVDIAVPRE
jgi:Cys-tRNA(Pro) deacylase